MAGSRQLKIEILGDARSAQKAFGDVEKSAGGLGTKLAGAFKSVGTIAAGFLAADAIKGGFDVLKNGIESTIAAAGESQRVATQTAAAIKSTGGAAGLTADQLGDYATQLSGIVPIDDEVIQSTENVLLTFRNIKGDNFKLATKATLDLATAMGTDTKSAALQLGKALNDPVGQMTALTRSGITFTAAQKDQIKAMVQAGDVAGAQTVILKELNAEFGGSAEAAGKTLPGAITILQTAIGNIQENIGTVLIPILTTATVWFASRLPAGIAIATDILQDLEAEVSGPFNYAWILARDSVLTFIQALQGDWVDSDKVRPIHELFGALGTSIGAVASILQLIAKGNFDQAFSRLADAVKLDAGVLRNLGSDLSRFLVDGLKGIGSRIASTVQAEIASVNWSSLPGQLRAFASGILNAIEADLRGLSWADVATIIMTGIGGYLVFGNGLGAAGISVGASILTWIKGEIQNTDWSSVGATIKSGIGSGLSFAGGLATQGVSLGGQLYDWVSGEVTSVDWSGIAGSIRDKIAEGFAVFVQGAKGAISAGEQLYNWISNEVTSVDWSAVASDIRSGIASGFTSVQQVAQGAISIGEKIKDWVIDQIQNTDWSQVGTTIQDKITAALQSVQGGGQPTPMTSGGGGGFLSVIKGQFDDLSTSIKGTANTIQTDFIGSIKNAAQQSGPFQTTLEKLGIGVGGIGAGAAIAAIKVASLGTASAAVNIVFAVLNTLVDGMAAGLDGFNTGIAAAVDLFRNWRNPIQGVRDALSDVAGLVDRTKTRWDDAFSIMGKSVGEWRQEIAQKVGEVISDFSSLPGKIQGYFAGAKNWLSSAGSDIVQGLIDGITGRFHDIEQTAQDLAGKVTGAVRGILGIHSPSTVMIEIGQNILQGLSIGLSQTDALIKAADSTSSQLVDAMITGITNGVSSDTMVPRLTKALLPSLLAAQQQAAQALDLAKFSGANDDDLAKLQAKLDAATSLVQRWQEFNQQTVDQFVKEATDAALDQKSQDALVSSWTQTFEDFGGIIDGTLLPSLKSKLADLNEQLKVALAIQAPQAIVDGIRAQISAVTTEIQQAGQVVTSAVNAGIIQPIQAMSDAVAAKVKAIASGMADKGASLVDSVVAGLESGKVKLQQAASILPKTVIPQIQQVIQSLQQNLAQALIDGTDPSGFIQNIQIMEALLKALGATVDETALKFNDFVAGRGRYQGPGSGYKTGGSSTAGSAPSMTSTASSGPLRPGDSGYFDYENNAQRAARAFTGAPINHNVVIVDGQVVHDSLARAKQRAYNARISAFGSLS